MFSFDFFEIFGNLYWYHVYQVENNITLMFKSKICGKKKLISGKLKIKVFSINHPM